MAVAPRVTGPMDVPLAHPCIVTRAINCHVLQVAIQFCKRVTLGVVKPVDIGVHTDHSWKLWCGAWVRSLTDANASVEG